MYYVGVCASVNVFYDPFVGGSGMAANLIKAGFARVKDLPTPLGKFSFLPNRDGSHEPSVQWVKDGKFQIVQ